MLSLNLRFPNRIANIADWSKRTALAMLCLAGSWGASVRAEDGADAAEVEDFTEMSVGWIAETQVTGVSKREQSPASAPASVTVINRDDLERFGYRFELEHAGHTVLLNNHTGKIRGLFHQDLADDDPAVDLANIFDGMDPNGPWTFRATDWYTGEQATVRRLILFVTP